MSDSRTPFLATQASAAYDTITALPVQILLDNVRSMYNVGSFFRTADAVRLEKLILGGITAYPPKTQITKTALGAEETVPWEYFPDPVERIQELHGRGYEIAAIETSVHAVDLFDWQPQFPVCLVFGHETDGIRPAVMNLCDTHVRIPMLGRKHSLNVATAGGVMLYELLRKFRRLQEPSSSR